MEISPPNCLKSAIHIPEKHMLGAGPSNASKRVLNVLNRQLIGQLHPETWKIMDEIKAGCQYIFQTRNPVTLCISGSGLSATEASFCNLLEIGDCVLFGVIGYWGKNAVEIAKRYGVNIEILRPKDGFGSALTNEEIENGLKETKPKVLFLVQGESSNGVLQPLEGVGDLCRKYNCILIVDAVASLGGTPFFADKWKVDVAFSASQKVLSASPGISPITFSERAMNIVSQRKTPISVYYWDINLLIDCWNCRGNPRIYHHTVPVTLLYGLRESLSMICKEGLESLIQRHKEASDRFISGIERIGLEPVVKNPRYRLPTVTAVKVPDGIDRLKVSLFAMKNFSVEISGGIGPLSGKMFRIGFMGENARLDRVDLLLKVLEEGLKYAQKIENNVHSKL